MDVLVEFELGQVVGLIRMAGMELELSEIIGRKVDMRTPSDLSRYFRKKCSPLLRFNMPKDDLIRLRHMLDAAKEALSFAKDKRKDLYANRMLALSIVKSMRLSEKLLLPFRKNSVKIIKEILWSNIIAMRNRLIHVYFDIDLNRVWDTLTDDLPLLLLC